jgi:hypothetical protein
MTDVDPFVSDLFLGGTYIKTPLGRPKRIEQLVATRRRTVCTVVLKTVMVSPVVFVTCDPLRRLVGIAEWDGRSPSTSPRPGGEWFVEHGLAVDWLT